jgi:low temperature requirement protein LtrA
LTVAPKRARLLAASRDPGRLGRSAYVFIHPIKIAGIIVVAAADNEVLARPTAVGDAATTWMILGDAILFLAGHALFKAVVWREAPWSRIVAVILLALLGLLALQIPALARVAAKLGAAPARVALAWLLQRSPNILLIPGTSSVEHLRENVQAATLTLPEEVFAELRAIGG